METEIAESVSNSVMVDVEDATFLHELDASALSMASGGFYVFGMITIDI